MVPPPRSSGLMSRSLIHTAAKLHYVEDLPQIEVARRMQVSTATVSRLLARARAEGIVRIEVVDIDESNAHDDTLATALGLQAARTVDTDRPPALSDAVSALLLDAALPQKAVIALGWGRMMQSVLAGGLPRIPGSIVVPTTGGMSETAAHFQINEFARIAAEQLDGTAHLLFAPARPDAELHAQLVNDSAIARIMEFWNCIDVAIMGIGNAPNLAVQNTLGFTKQETGRVIGDIVRHYFDEDGTPVPWPGQTHQMGISRPQLSRIPLSIGVCTGIEKVAPIISAARTGMINSLVTDARTASAVLDTLSRGNSA